MGRPFCWKLASKQAKQQQLVVNQVNQLQIRQETSKRACLNIQAKTHMRVTVKLFMLEQQSFKGSQPKTYIHRASIKGEGRGEGRGRSLDASIDPLDSLGKNVFAWGNSEKMIVNDMPS